MHIESHYRSVTMSMRDPRPRFSDNDKRLLHLLSRLALEAAGDRFGSNVEPGRVILTDSEASELLVLLERFVSSSEFLEGTFFVEGVASNSHEIDGRVRRTFEAARARRGRSKTAGWIQWYEFRRRFFFHSQDGYGPTRPMTFDYFMQMEQRLFRDSGIDARVANLATRLVRGQRDTLERIRAGQQTLPSGSIRTSFLNTANSLRNGTGGTMRPERIAGAITVVANMGVLFTTRDWGVAGTISTMAGSSILALMH